MASTPTGPSGARLIGSAFVDCALKVLLIAVFTLGSANLTLQVIGGAGGASQLPRRGALNASSFTFVAFVLLMVLYSRRSSLPSGPAASAFNFKRSLLPGCAVALTAIAVYAHSVGDPFLFDDYTHLREVAAQSWGQMIAQALFVHPTAGDFFFRPLGYISYWLDYRWAGFNVLLWHSWNVLVHGTNSVLVYALARQLRLSTAAAVFAGSVFALHASHAEVTGWTAARFDLLAFLFAALALIAFNRFIDTRGAHWLWVMLLATLLAVLSKEAAFCLPLMALCMIPFRRAEAASIARLSGRMLRLSACMAAVCALVFLYRGWFLQGVGGYKTAHGTPEILNFHLASTANALLFRLWGLLLLPLNWSMPPGVWLAAGWVLMLAAATGFLVISRPQRGRLLGSLGFVLAAALPVQHLLLIGPEFTGSRVLYLPTLGLAIFWGVLLDGCRKTTVAYILAGAILVFQAGTLEHNLLLRSEAAYLSQRACMAVGDELKHDARPMVAEGLPPTWKGVYFLANGFVPCVEIESRVWDLEKRLSVSTGRAVPSPGTRVFTWNAAAEKLVENTPKTGP